MKAKSIYVEDCCLIGSDEVPRCCASRIAISVPSAERDACERLVGVLNGRPPVPPLDVLVVPAERRIHETPVKIVRELRKKTRHIKKINIYNNEKKKVYEYVYFT
jgi:hypothetical protein